jgi:hypothetical protein
LAENTLDSVKETLGNGNGVRAMRCSCSPPAWICALPSLYARFTQSLNIYIIYSPPGKGSRFCIIYDFLSYPQLPLFIQSVCSTLLSFSHPRFALLLTLTVAHQICSVSCTRCFRTRNHPFITNRWSMNAACISQILLIYTILWSGDAN